MCDAQSVKPDDLVPTDIIRKRFVGETCFALHNTDHKWYYLSRQRTDEVTIFKIYDSKPGVRAKCMSAPASHFFHFMFCDKAGDLR